LDREQEKNQNSPEALFRFLHPINAPNGSHWRVLKFLPIHDRSDTKTHYLLGVDNRETLHIVTSEGRIIFSDHTGHTSPVNTLAVDFRLLSEIKLATGSQDGEVRIFTINSPARPGKNVKSRPPNRTSNSSNETKSDARPIETEKKAEPMLERNSSTETKKTGPWVPSLKLTEAWYPTKMTTIRGVSHRFFQVHLNGSAPEAISGLDFATKGRQLNLVVGDVAGRVSLHLRNGSMTASFRTPGNGSIRCVVCFENFAALCTSEGLYFMETKERRMVTHGCQTSPLTDEALPDWDAPPPPPPPPNVSDGNLSAGNHSVQPRPSFYPRKRREAPVPLEGGIMSFAPDLSSKTAAFAGTDDGRVLALQVSQLETLLVTSHACITKEVGAC
jgi:WD40 repeat protein